MTQVTFDVETVLVGLGFEGKFLADLKTMIHTEEDYLGFENFILLNDHRLQTRFIIVSEYRRLLVASRNVMSEERFIERIKTSHRATEKVLVMEELFLHSVEPSDYLYYRMLELSDDVNFLSEVYNKYLEYPLHNPLFYVKNIYSKYRV